ncbi:transcription initiation factor TFIID 23-30kDa subunit-domain-containing protein, partial [Obelidium mucronatum]
MPPRRAAPAKRESSSAAVSESESERADDDSAQSDDGAEEVEEVEEAGDDSEHGENDDDDDGDANDDGERRDAKRRKKDVDDERREKGLLDLLALMDECAPLIPDAVTDHYLAQAGFECEDVRVKRLLALATQKFIADVAQDAFHYSKIRQQAMAKEKKTAIKKTVLTI